VAHEVRNPLFGIGALLDVLATRLPTPDPDEPLLGAIRGELARLDALMSNLLELSRPAPAGLERAPLSRALTPAVRACAAAAADARVSVEVSPHPELDVEQEPARLQLAFQHLIENAVRHSPPGSTVRVEVRSAPAGVEVSVLDAGPGFAEQDLRRLFEPFSAQRRDGSGLGLAIVQRIVELHRGTVAAANRAAGGAEVTVTLPAAAGSAA
jgi:signal transduction histidine kinase